MPEIDDAAGLPARVQPEKSEPSRRSVLRGAGAAGAAGIAAAAFTGALPAAAATRSAAPDRGAQKAHAGDAEPVIVHVRNAATGELDVFRGTTHTRVRDQEMAARLVRASR